MATQTLDPGVSAGVERKIFSLADIQARGKDQSDFIKRKFCSYQ